MRMAFPSYLTGASGVLTSIKRNARARRDGTNL